MAKKGLLVLIIAALAATGAFAQNDFASMAKNTVTVDFGPTIAGLVVRPLSSTLTSLVDNNVVKDIKPSGFSIAAQYERQLLRQVSVAGRLVYGGPKADFTYSDDGVEAIPNLSLTSLAVEGHARLYPFGETFFLDGMVGYAHLEADLSGTVVAMIGSTPQVKKAEASAKNNYLKLGGKLGLRTSFGKKGGLTFESAIGYYYGIPLGDDLGKKVMASLKSQIGEYKVYDFADYFSILEKYVLIGGPRVTLALGYRF